MMGLRRRVNAREVAVDVELTEPGERPDRRAVMREVFGRLVMARRKRAGLTLRALAEAAGMSRPALGRIERGATGPNLEQLRRIALALQTTAGELVGEFDRAIGYLEARGTRLLEAAPGEARERGRLEPANLAAVAFARLVPVVGPALVKEIEASLGWRPDPPRTRDEAFVANCALAGVELPRDAADVGRAQRELALAILEDRVDPGDLTTFGSTDDELEEQAEYFREAQEELAQHLDDDG
jgi:transcriptional regulator with XRE-family HTH domain